MPRVSRKIISINLSNELNQNFSSLISSLRNPVDISNFLEGFLTKEEKKMIPKRLMLHLMLFNNISDSEITAHLGISYETIRTHKNNWDTLSNDYKKIIGELSKRKSIRDSLKKLDKKLGKIDNFLSAKSDMKARGKVFDDN